MASKKEGLSQATIEAETRRLASDLAFHVRRPVNIQLVGGNHIAYTYNCDETNRPIPIVMNPSILSKIRNEDRAIKIWRGIGFHELAHHLWPAEAQYRQANKEGFQQLFNLVDDEQNERRGRALDETWGACFQSVCAFIFPGKEQSETTLIPGIVDGDKKPKAPKGRAAAKTYIKRWNMFAFHLRRHVPNCPDEAVAAALALIPKDFKDLEKEELFELTRRIHEALLIGVILPTQDPNAKPVNGKPGEKLEPDSDEDDEDEQDEEEEPEPEPEPEEEPKPDDKKEEKKKTTWNLRKLLSSKWTYAPFGLFIILWFALLMQGGVNFWVRVFFNTLIIGGVITAFLFWRRAMIKAMLARIKAAASGAMPSAPTKRISLGPIIVGAVQLTIGGGLIYLAFRFMPWPVAVMATSMGCSITVFIWYRKSRRKAKSSEGPPSKLAILVMSLFALGSFGAMLFSLKSMGVHNLWLEIATAVLGFCLLGGTLLLVNDNQVANSRGQLTPMQRLKRRIVRTREAIIRGIKRFFGSIWNAVWDFICDVAAFIWSNVTRFARFVWHWTVIAARRIRWKLSGPLLKAWRHPLLRIAIIALPVAVLLVIIWALVTKAGTYGWWVAVIVALLLLALLIAAFIFRKKIKRFVVQELFMPMPQLMDAMMQPPLDFETEWFNQIEPIVQVEPDQALLDSLLPQIYPLAQQLKPLLERCGRATVDLEDQPEGFDLTDEADLALVGETSVFITDDMKPKASVHFEVALDCSGSMASPTKSLKPGEKFLLGKFFALVLEQACMDMPGVSAKFWGFTHDQIYDCGSAGEGRSSGLVCGGGNNDAAMLWHMGQSAAASGKDIKVLLMLSDGQPSDCSWLSLHNLVLQFEQEGMIPWNFALDVINTPAFERFFTDLVGLSMPEAIDVMGETLAAITEGGG
jgi:hypothetical protein